MSMSTSLSRRSAGLQGEVIRPGQPRFDEARRAFNLAADQEPAAVVFAESVHDIVAPSPSPPATASRSRRRAPVTTPCRSDP